jgi:hypothetical protein
MLDDFLELSRILYWHPTLTTRFAVRSVFGRPMRFASRTAGEQFLARHYRRFVGRRGPPLRSEVMPAVRRKREQIVPASRRFPAEDPEFLTTTQF